MNIKKLDATTYGCDYTPHQPGTYTINITYGDQHITKSPFVVEVGPFKLSKIKAYGPGLHGGMVGKPATFVVETHGETGALGKLLIIDFFYSNNYYILYCSLAYT